MVTETALCSVQWVQRPSVRAAAVIQHPVRQGCLFRSPMPSNTPGISDRFLHSSTLTCPSPANEAPPQRSSCAVVPDVFAKKRPARGRSHSRQ